MKNKLLLIIMLLLLSFSIVAEEPVVTEQPAVAEFDYAKGDFSTVENWNNIDWNKIDYSNPNFDFSLVPVEFAEKVDALKAIAAGRGKELTVEQVTVNLEKVESLLDFDEDKVKQAIHKETGVAVHSLGRQAKIENGILLSTEGSFDFNQKKGWEVTINAKGEILILKPAEINENVISHEDAFLITVPTNIVTKSGKINVHSLRYFGGKAFVMDGETAKVGDNIVKAIGNDIEVHFEKGEYEGNYVVITEDSLDIGTEKEGYVQIEPQPGNKLFNMRKKKYTNGGFEWIPDERDTLGIKVEGGDGLSATSREAEGKTPLVKHKHNEGRLFIDTGRVNFDASEEIHIGAKPISKNPSVKTPMDLSNSVAFEFQTEDHTLVTTSSNRYSLYNEGGETSSNRAGLRVNTNYDDNAIKTIDDLKYLYPDKKFEKEDIPGYKDVTANMAQFVDEWLKSDPIAGQLVKSINFNTEFNAASVGGVSHLDGLPDVFKKVGHFQFGERVIDGSLYNKNPVRDIKNILDVGSHELRHGIDGYIERYEKEDYILPGQKDRIGKEGIRAKYLELRNLLHNQISKDPEFRKLVSQMEKTTSIKLVRNSQIAYKLGEFISEYGNQISDKNYGKVAQIHIKFHHLLKKKYGIPNYALELDPTRARVFPKQEVYSFTHASEIPTTFEENDDQTVRQRVEAGNEYFRRMVQLEYDIGRIPESKYKDLMGSYCDNNLCERCLEYKLTCKSRPEVKFYAEN